MSSLGKVLRRPGIICALVCWFSNSVAADPVRLTSDRLVTGRAAAETADFGSFDRSAEENTSVLGRVDVGVADFMPTPEFGLPPLSAFFATQHTDVSATRWFGSGTAQTESMFLSDSNYGFGSAESAMFIEFTLAKPMSYFFTGTLTTDGDAFSSVSLDGPVGLGWVFTNSNAVPLVAMRRGLLSPGDYFFHATASASSDAFARRRGTSAFDLQFTLSSPVPEPATVLLFGTGAAFVGRRAFRRRREQLVAGR